MDGLGRVASVDIDDGRRRTVSFAYAPEGQVLNRAERSSASLNPEDQRYFVAGRQVGELTSDGNGDPSQLDYATNLNSVRNWTPNPQSAPFRWNGATGITRGTFGVGAGYEAINGGSTDDTGSAYTASQGDTLQSIALAVWGDANLWYLIADANGLSAGSQLTQGQQIAIPNKARNSRNSADVFRPYDPNDALGNLSPTSPKPVKKPGTCAVVGQIMMVAIAVAVVAILAPPLTGHAAVLATETTAAVAGTGLAGALGATGGAIAAGAIAGAAGSIASQAFGVAAGVQSKFDWKGVGMAALGGAVGGALGPNGIMTKGVFRSVGSSFVRGALTGALSATLTQGVGVATGLQKNFDWLGVAAGGLSGGVSEWVDARLNTAQVTGRLSSTLANGISSAASAVANAGLRSAVTGTSFGDNLLAALPDVIGGTIGNMTVKAISAAGDRRDGNQSNEPHLDPMYSKLPDSNDSSFEIELNMTAQGDSLTHALGIFGKAESITKLYNASMQVSPPPSEEFMEEMTRPYTGRGVAESLYNGLRNEPGRITLDTVVGRPLEHMEWRWEDSNPGAAQLLREFRTGRGPSHRIFEPSDSFSIGFFQSDTTQYHLQRALRDWRTREGGMTAHGGVYSNYRGTFSAVAVGWEIGWPLVRPTVRLVGSPEANVIGSFGLEGRLQGRDRIVWKATNTMSLSSFFYENWIPGNIANDRYRPQAYGNTTQQIYWVTDLRGRQVR